MFSTVPGFESPKASRLSDSDTYVLRIAEIKAFSPRKAREIEASPSAMFRGKARKPPPSPEIGIVRDGY